MNDKKSQGYLLEVPILLIIVGLLLTIFLPMIHNIIVKKILLSIGIIIFLLCSYYIIVIPGWQPNQTPSSAIWRLTKFIILAAWVLWFTIQYLLS